MDVTFLDELNDSQREAVLSLDGPLMIIAGAGSGKTRVITYRLAFILSQGLADPQELLALTFTNKAAKEMKARIQALVGPEAKGLMMGTFHSIFARILRAEAERIGFTRNFTIYDSDDSQQLVKTLLQEQQLDDKTYKPRIIHNLISGSKNRFISPQQFRSLVYSDIEEKAAKIYELYEQRLLKANAMDFDDLLLKPIQLFQQHPAQLHKYQHHFKYLMVDEYQDTNHVQYLICRMLAAAHENICVVGDDSQSIYAFRGANIDNILNFKRDYPEASEIRLERNYRSTRNIVEAANTVIARNKRRLEKRIFSENEAGEPINVVIAASDQDEAQQVTSMIREQRQMNNWFNKDFAILYRTNAQSRAMEDQLRRAGIPYRIYGGLSFYQRKEIKDLVAYLRLAINPFDEQALLRVINYPARGIGKTSIDRLVVTAEQLGIRLWEMLEQPEKTGIGSGVVNKVKDFAAKIERFGIESRRLDAYEMADFVAKESGLLKELHNTEALEDLSRWENVQELLSAAREFTETQPPESRKLEHFLAEIALFSDADKQQENDDVVSLMTIHASKGLEFKSVFVVGMEENLFPSPMAEKLEDLEEERRLFYVAMTRAEKRLTLTLARSRYRFGDLQFNEPSRFLEEIDPQYMRMPRQAVNRSQPLKHPTPAPRSEKPRQAAAPAPVAPPAGFNPSDPDLIATGMNVMHAKFGIGRIQNIESGKEGKKATVVFGNETKVLLLKYAKLMIVS